MIRFTMGEDIAEGQIAYVDEEDGLLYDFFEKAEGADGEPADEEKCKVCENCIVEKVRFTAGLQRTYTCKLKKAKCVFKPKSFSGFVDDFRAPLNAESPKRKSFREFFADRNGGPFKEAFPGKGTCDRALICLAATIADYMDHIASNEPEAEPLPPTTEDHKETCVDRNCKGCGEPQEPKEPEQEYKFQCYRPRCMYIFKKPVRRASPRGSILCCPKCLLEGYTMRKAQQ